MSNVQTVRQLIDAVMHDNVAAFQALLADNVRWEHHPTGNTAQDADVPYMRLREGRDAAGGFLRDIAEDFDMNHIEVLGFMEGDARVAALIAYELTVRSTGRTIRDQEIHLYEFDEQGRVSTFRHFLDTAKAVHAHAAHV